MVSGWIVGTLIFGGELSHLVTPEDERNARLQILQRIRANAPERFFDYG